MISIGAIFEGPEHQDSYARRAIIDLQKATKAVVGSSKAGGETPGVNVVFYVAGSFGAPDWDWVRDAKFSRRRRLLMVQVAVAEEMVNSPELRNFLIKSLHAANTVAFHFFEDKGIKYPLREAEDTVLKIKDRLASSSSSAENGKEAVDHDLNR